MESNHRPAVYETAALPTELRRLSRHRLYTNRKRDLTQDVKHLSMQRCIHFYNLFDRQVASLAAHAITRMTAGSKARSTPPT